MSGTLSQPPIVSFIEMATSISEIHQAHAHLLKTGIFYNNTLSSNKLISFAVSNPEPITLSYAHSVLTHVANPNSFSFNSLIRAYANSRTPQNAIFIFLEMLEGPVFPDKYSFTFVLKACAGFSGMEEGRQIHGQVLKTGIGSDVFVANTLIHVYGKSGHFGIARTLLDRMSNRDVVSWNALLSAYIETGFIRLARGFFDEMEEKNVESWNFMISGYLSSGLLEEARSIFDRMPAKKDVVSWNAMITSYAHASCFGEVLVLFESMQREEVKPDNCTLVNVLSACAHLGALGQGEWIHAYIDKNGIGINGFIATALVDMYSKCGNVEKALNVFRNASQKDISTWNSMIVGLGMHGYGENALETFSEMLMESFEPNEVTFIAVLSACSRAGLLNDGRRMFQLMVDDYGIQPTIEHYGCLVDLLGRVGLLEEALELVKTRPLKEAPVLWESLLSACKNHGSMEMAEHVAKKLLELNPKDSAGYVQLSNTYAALKRWDDVLTVRRKMKALQINKEPGCSMIEVNGVVHEFLAGEGMIREQIWHI